MQPRSDHPNGVVRFTIGRCGMNSKVIPIISEQSNQYKHCEREENHAEYVVPAVRFAVIRSCFPSHGARLMESASMTMKNARAECLLDLESGIGRSSFAG